MGKNKKKTHNEFIKEMKIKHPNLTILNEYKNSKTRIKYKCRKCELEWEATAAKLSMGRGCPRCAGNKKKSHEEYVKQLSKINPNIEVKSEYLSTAHNMTFKCKICGYEWVTKPGGPLRGKGCFWCGKKNMSDKLRKDMDSFLKELPISRTYDVLTEYHRRQSKVLCHCKLCNGNWWVMPQSLLKGHGCPYCSKSHGEKEIDNLLNFYNIKYISQYKFNNLKGVGGNNLSYDFFLPDYNLLIEYQGKQHKQPIEFFGGIETFKTQKEHDKRKREYAFNNNINLLEIWYYENIENKLKKTLNLETVTTAGDE